VSASEHLQRRLFFTAGELVNFGANDDPSASSLKDSNLYQEHVYQSKGPSLTYSGLREDIKKNGVRTPVRLNDRKGAPTIMDGHHRTAIAHDLNPDSFIPVQYGY
jgi:hypothetical protein